MPKYTAMLNKVMLSTESRMRGDMQVRFGGRYGKTYCRKAVRRSVPSLRLGEGGSIIDLVMRLERCDFAHAVRLLRTERGYRSLHPDLCRLYRPFPRSVSSPTHRFVIRHCSTIYGGAVSFRRLPALIVGRYAIRSMAENISPSDFRTMPADGSCARNASKEVHRPNRLRRSTTAPIR